MPAKQGGWGHDGIEIAQGFPADLLGQPPERPTLCRGEDRLGDGFRCNRKAHGQDLRVLLA